MILMDRETEHLSSYVFPRKEKVKIKEN